jgi:hypothetical protein
MRGWDDRRTMRPLTALFVVGAAALPLAGCGGDHVTPDEARSALRGLPYEVAYREVPSPSGTVFAGEAVGPSGARVRFGVALDGAPFSRPLIHSFGGQSNIESTRDWLFISNENTPQPGVSRRVEGIRVRMAENIVQAVCREWNGKGCGI